MHKKARASTLPPRAGTFVVNGLATMFVIVFSCLARMQTTRSYFQHLISLHCYSMFVIRGFAIRSLLGWLLVFSGFAPWGPWTMAPIGPQGPGPKGCVAV